MDTKLKILSALTGIVLLGGCAATAAPDRDMLLTQGPIAKTAKSVTTVITPYDKLLNCMADSVTIPLSELPVVGVGAVSDRTGKATHSDGGNGTYITQAAGDIVQSALMQSGAVIVVNRRDPRVMALEKKFGNKNVNWTFTKYHITGSINSLDFLPGGGAEINIAGIGAKYRQYRMIVGMDLFLTETNTSRIIGSTSVTKQIVATDMGVGVGRFFGNTLVSIDIGQQNREATHVALRGMLKMAVFELLENLHDAGSCREIVADVEGVSEPGTQAEIYKTQIHPVTQNTTVFEDETFRNEN